MARIRGPLKNERLVIKNKSGRFTKFKSDRDLFFYYYDSTKPKGKRYRPLFKTKKKGLPQARRLSALQLKFITAKRTSRRGATLVDSVTIKIHSRDYIINQLLEKKTKIMGLIRPFQRKQKITFVYCDVKTSDGSEYRSPMLAIGSDWSSEQVLKTIAIELIINTLSAQSVRMSPKRKKCPKKHQWSALVRIAVAKF